MATAAGGAGAPAPNLIETLRSREYLRLLVVAAILGVIVSALAYGFLKLVNWLQGELFTSLPSGLGFKTEPTWWPLPLLVIGGLLVGLTIQYLPGRGGHSPADGFKAGGRVFTGREIPGVFFAALATLAFGAVLGPEAPLIVLGGGFAAYAVRLASKDVPDRAATMVAAAGSFAAISTLLGSPLLGAFLLMEASGLGGAMMELVLIPGLVAAGVGSLIFVGLDAWTGFGTFSLAIPNLPPVGSPTLGEFIWAIVIGVLAAALGTAIHRIGLGVRPHIERRLIVMTPLAGAVVALLAVIFVEVTGKPSSDVLFSGQNQLGPLIGSAATYSVGALVMILVCKGIAYGVSLGSFRGGPVFPSMFIGAAGGMALSHSIGLPMVTGVAMGIGAMCAVMLRLPLTSVLLATLLLLSDGLKVMPLVIIAVTVAYVVSARFVPTAAAARDIGAPDNAPSTLAGGASPSPQTTAPASGSETRPTR